MSTSTQEYLVLLHGDENVWRQADEATRTKAYEDHMEFARRCEARGHRITGGAELRPSETSVVVRQAPAGGLQVTEGPFTETVEQLGGYYVVETADVADLADAAGILVGDDTGAVEIRPYVPADEQPGGES